MPTYSKLLLTGGALLLKGQQATRAHVEPPNQFAVPDILAVQPLDDVKLNAMVKKDVSNLRGRQTRHDAVGHEVEQNDPVKEFGEEVEHVTEEHVVKPLMDSIHVFRMMMCWERPELLEHKKCMTYMTTHCSEGRSGKGYCKKLTSLLKDKCTAGDDRAAPYARKLGLSCSSVDEEKTKAEMAEIDNFQGKDDDPNDELEVGQVAPGPAPGPMSGPGPAPAPAPFGQGIDKSYRPLPNQGYDEFSVEGKDPMVMHESMKTHTSDWRMEWPDTDETEEQSVERICKKKPDLDWCQLYLKDRARQRGEFAGKAGGPEIPTNPDDMHDAAFERRKH